MYIILTYSAVFLFTCIGVKIFRRWCLRRGIVAVPNERSLHRTPVPQGGGLVIVTVCLAFYAIYINFLWSTFSWGYFLGAILIAIVSWLDDLYAISFIWRFLVHSLAALLVICTLGYFQDINYLFGSSISIGFWEAIATFFWIVWMTNAYNFMDGADGLAGVQSVTAGIGWLSVGLILGVDGTGFTGGLLAFTGLGFLTQNWQPAKIFMGDVGSAFFGFSFAVLPLMAIKENSELNQGHLQIVAIVLVWLFLWDTILTLFRRLVRGEKVWLAHRGHIYQRYIVEGFSHRYVAGLYGILSALNVCFLLMWLYFKNGFGFVLLIVIGLEAFGLLIYLRLIQNKKTKTSINSTK